MLQETVIIRIAEVVPTASLGQPPSLDPWLFLFYLHNWIDLETVVLLLRAPTRTLIMVYLNTSRLTKKSVFTYNTYHGDFCSFVIGPFQYFVFIL